MDEDMAKQQRTFLLRCWQEGRAISQRTPDWRFSVEEVLGQKDRRGFGHLEDIFDFLQTELAGSETDKT